MKRVFLIAVVAVSFFNGTSLLGYVPSQATQIRLPYFAPGKVLIKLKPGYQIKDLQSQNKRIGIVSVRRLGVSRWFCLWLPKGKDVLEIVQEYKTSPAVELAEPSYLRYFLLIPNDEHFSKQWSLKQANDKGIDADLAWDITYYWQIVAKDTTGMSTSGDIWKSLLDYEISTETAIKELSFEIFAGIYYTNKRRLCDWHGITLPAYIGKTGIKCTYRTGRVTSSILLSYSTTKNLNYLMVHYTVPLPLLNLRFSLSNFSFLCSYRKNFFTRIGGYAGGGIAIFNANLSYHKYIIEKDIYEEEKQNVVYLSPFIATGLLLNIGTDWYISVQGEVSLPYFTKWGSTEINLKETLPGFTLSLGYKFNFKRRWP